MPITIDDRGLYTGLERLLARIDQVTDTGLARGADHLEQVARATSAYEGMSGATRASTTAYAIGPNSDGSAEATQGFAAAVDQLTGFTGHQGQAVSQDSGVVLGPDEKGIILTVFTDYIDLLERELAGDKAFLGPTLASEDTTVTAIVAEASREALR